MPIQNKRKDVVERRSQPHPILSGDQRRTIMSLNHKEDQNVKTLI